MSTALYRRYRPETFGDVIGQEHVTAPLMQALRTGRVNHAYLFSGPRGCGKTTSARILARCLNCEQGPTAEPCGTCESCVALARGGPGTVDVIEIDAASHGGVDDARDLRERASYGPAQSRYKIYIIDEAHMVTPQGFNALLKIVEEPPEHVKFVFATTEPDKVIGTIRSRTHHYPFRLVPPARLQSYLEELCTREGVAVAPGVLSFVVRAGSGSVRDSLSVLDQLIAGSGEEGLTYESASALLGFTDGELLDATIDAFAAADGAGVFRSIDKVIETGLDPRRFVEDLLERLRDLIVIAAVPDGAGAVLRHLPPDQLERMRTQAVAFGSAALTRAADITNAGLTEMTGATAPRLQLELIAARILLPAASGEGGYAARLDRIERRLASGPAALGEPGSAAPAPAPGPVPVSAPGPVRVGGPPEGHLPPPASGPGAQPSAGAPASGSPAPPRPAVEHEQPQPAGAATAVGVPAAMRDPVVPSTPPPPFTTASSGPGSPEAGSPQGRGVAATPGALDTAALRRHWPEILGKVFERRRVTWTFLSEHGQIVDFDGSRVLLGISTPPLLETFRRGQHGEYVRMALIDVLGLDVPVDAVAGEGAAQSSAARAPGMPVAAAPAPPLRPETEASPRGEPEPAGSPEAEPKPDPGPDPGGSIGAGAPGGPGGGHPVQGGGRTAYAGFVDQPGSWGSAPPDPATAPSWATSEPDLAHESPLAAARAAVAEETEPTEAVHVVDDSVVSEDDESVDELTDVGLIVVERLLGGRVISEEGA